MNLQERLEQLQTQLAEWEAQSPRNQNKIDAINAEIARTQEQLRETETREQKTGELLDEYNLTLNNIFDAILPETVYVGIFGINEYNEKRSDFKRCMGAYYGDKIASINAEHIGEIELWRDKFGNLTAQAQDMATKVEEMTESEALLNMDIDKVNDELNNAHTKISALEAHVKDLEKIIETGKAANAALTHENSNYRDHIVELNKKIEQASKPKETTPSESLNKVLEEVKSRKQMNTDELMRRYEARLNNPKVMAIDHGKIAIPELPYIPTAEVAAPVVGQSANIPDVTDEQFRSSAEGVREQAVLPEDGTGTPGDEGSGMDNETVSRTELEARFKRIENQLGLKSWRYDAEDVA